MVQVLGALLVVAGVVAPTYWLVTGRKKFPSFDFLVVVAVVSGLALVISDRIVELGIPGGGTIKAAVKQAVADQGEIAAIKERIEGQASTIDAVAKSAADAKELVDDLDKKTALADSKLDSLDQAIKSGSEAVETLKAQAEYSATVLAAQSNDRKAYDTLWNWSEDPAYAFRKEAAQAAERIMDEHNPTLVTAGHQVPWNQGVEPEKLSLDQLRQNFDQAPPTVRIALVEYVWTKRADISKKDRLAFLADVLATDEHLDVVEHAGRYFAGGSGNKFKPLAISAHLDWWAKNKDAIQ